MRSNDYVKDATEVRHQGLRVRLRFRLRLRLRGALTSVKIKACVGLVAP